MIRKSSLRLLALMLALIIIFGNLTACGKTPISEPELDPNSVASMLAGEEGIPDFDKGLFYLIETCFHTYYYTDLPDSKTLFDRTKSAFFEYSNEIDTTSFEEVTRALIDCYTYYAVGDLYAYYRSADEYEEYSSDMSGSFIGIGVAILRNDLEKTIFVNSVEPDSPASKAGILPGDYIVAVGEERIDEIGTVDLVNKIRGEEGTEVSVTVKRGETEITFNMIRERITETTVSYSLIEGTDYGYVKIASFKANTPAQFMRVIRTLEEQNVSGIIIDLRKNPGGYVSAVASMLSFLVPTGTPIASFSSDKESLYASHGGIFETDDHVLSVPSVVMCDEHSASGAELFSGAMRDYNDMGILKSTLVGQTTYKKGIMQSTIPFTDGSTLTMTTALYNPPSGQNFHGVGVSPDVFVQDGQDYMTVAIAELTKLVTINN